MLDDRQRSLYDRLNAEREALANLGTVTVDPNTGAPTTTTDSNATVTTDPNPAGTSPNAGHIRYITNGQ